MLRKWNDDAGPTGGSMKALAILRYKAPMEVLELPPPEPGPGDLLVRVRAASVNPLDFKIRSGGVSRGRRSRPAQQHPPDRIRTRVGESAVSRLLGRRSVRTTWTPPPGRLRMPSETLN